MVPLLHRFSIRTLLSLPRCSYSQAVTPPAQSTPVSTPPHPTLPYFVPRNSNGNLPVYSDIRNNGTRHLILIRNVDGQAHKLAQELRTTLFRAASSNAARARVEIKNSKDVVITGEARKNEVIDWLKARGF